MQLGKLSLIVVLVCIGSCQYNKKEQKNDSSMETNTILEVASTDIQLDKNKGHFFYKEKPFTGKSISKYPNGYPAKIAHFKMGKREGLFQKFFPDSTLSFACHYRNGKLNGEVKSWWKNGKIRSISNFQNGIAHGLQEEWYKSGSKFKELNLVEGKEVGFQKAWRENGKVYNNYEAKNGRIFGLKRSTLCYSLEDEIVQK